MWYLICSVRNNNDGSVDYISLTIKPNLQEAIDYIRHLTSSYVYSQQFVLFVLRDEDKLIARYIDNKIFID